MVDHLAATYDVRNYLRVRQAYKPSFSPDGDRLTFVMDLTGTPQAWLLDRPSAWPAQLTAVSGEIRLAIWSPTREYLLVEVEPDGRERTQLYRLEGGELTPLTDHPDAAHWWGGWSNDGERFAFTANRRDDSAFDVYVQDARSTEATLVRESDGWCAVSGWGPRDERLVLKQSWSDGDDYLYLLDVECGDLEQITPDTGEATFRNVNWGPDGRSIYLITDQNADATYVARLDLDSGELTPILQRANWNVDGINVDADTSRFACGLNVDGYSRLILGELTGPTTYSTFPQPDLVRGVMGEATFHPDGERVALTLSSRTSGTNVYVVDIAAGEATKWTHAPMAAIPPETFVEPELVRYESFDGREIPAFFSLPQDTRPGSTPAIVDVHGGPEQQRRPGFFGTIQYFLKNGYAVLEPNVRGSTGYGASYVRLDDGRNRRDAIADVVAGAEWLCNHPAIDPTSVVVRGSSYGGFMALVCSATSPDLWAAVVAIAPITDLPQFLESTAAWRRPAREAEYGSLDDDQEFLEAISPISNVDDIEAPVLAIHGENDERVPVEETERFVDAARQAGVDVELLLLESEGHQFTTLDNKVRAHETTMDFLRRQVE